MDQKIRQLEKKSGKEFDKEFLEIMIEHHQQGVNMSLQAEEKTENKEIKDMAEQIISKQEEEIDEMKEMLEKIEE